MEYSCLNCITPITDNFCSQCGQKKYKRIDRKYIWDEIQYTTIHTNKGFLYSVKNVFKNPGKTARKFLDGNRVNHYKPISLAFILSGISAFVSFKVIGLDKLVRASIQNNPQMSSPMMQDYLQFTNKYSAFLMLAFLPILAFFSRFLFRKSQDNYYEHIVMNAFGLSFYNIFYVLLIAPIIYFLKENAVTAVKISNYSFCLFPIMMTWFYINVYPERSYKNIFFRVLTILFLLVALLMLIGIATAIYMVISKGAVDGAIYMGVPKPS